MIKQFMLILVMIVLTISFIGKANAEENSKMKIASKAVILVDSETGQILFAKNPDKKLYPASLTKIATAIYAIENGHLDDRVTISKNAVQTDGTRVYLVESEQVTLRHLLQGLLINSGNDAGVAIAEYMCGNVKTFSNKLNEFLQEKIHVYDTHFVNPHGLFNKNHYTTVSDLAKITDYALKNDSFREIFGTKELKWEGKGWHTTLFTHHLMLKGEIPYPEVTGGKTGYVDQSGQTLATTAENQNIHLTVITMDAASKQAEYQDTKTLLDYGFNNYKTATIPKNSTFTVNNKVFKIHKDLRYTVPLHLQVFNRITKNGLLEIVDRKGKTVHSFQLSESNVMEATVATSNSKGEVNNSTQNPWTLSIILVIGLGMIWMMRGKLLRK